ncbi:unnamed protein product [Sympodiomycopsis kandeliae]
MDVGKLDNLQTQEYWDQRYAKEEGNTYDWFKKFDDIKHVILPHIPNKDAKILELGCGNSTITPGLHSMGYTNLTSIDFSPTLISQMRSQFPQITFHCLDIRDLLSPSSLSLIGPLSSYDLIIDKGTLDALVAEKGSVWDPSQAVRENAAKEIDAVVQLLKPGATFLYMTWQQKQFRLLFLERPQQWDIQCSTIEAVDANKGGWDYFLFTGRKHS